MGADSKKTAALIIAGAPPPDEMDEGDEGESEKEKSDEEDAGAMGGKMALRRCFSALRAGDEDKAWDAFMDAVQSCRGYGK